MPLDASMIGKLRLLVFATILGSVLAEGACDFQVDTDYQGGDFASHGAASQQECCDACGSVADCVVAVYLPGICYLKTSKNQGSHSSSGRTACVLSSPSPPSPPAPKPPSPPTPPRFTIVDSWNAVPAGSFTTKESADLCQASCVDPCTQFSWNKISHHCYTSAESKWGGIASDHITSGCRPDKVDECGIQPAPSPTPPPYLKDGVIRANGEGRFDAYLPPPFSSNHASMVEQLPDGSLHMGWFSGKQEGQDNVAIVYASVNSSKEGSIWTSAKVLSQREGYSNQNAVLHYDRVSSKLHVFHSQQGAGAGESAATVWHLEAKASGYPLGEFTTPSEILSFPGSFDKNRVLPLLDGSWLLPIYGQDKSPNYPKNAFLPAGADANNPKAWTTAGYGADCNDMVQPSVVRLKAGEPNLLVFFRDRKSRSIYTASSPDDGKSWTSCKATSLPNNNAGIQAHALRSGRIALVYNPQTYSRDPLAISLSEDAGKTWKYTRVLDHIDGKHELSYPTLREDVRQDGVIHVSYTYKRVCIKHSIVSEDWIMAGDVNMIV